MEGIGLALGGGAVRGVAHLGVIDVLTEAKIPIAAVSGTSVGALVAAVYATQPAWPGAKALAQQIDDCSLNPVKRVHRPASERRKLYNHLLRLLGLQKALLRAAFTKGAFSGRGLDAFIESILGDLTFSDTHLPLFIATTDIDTGDYVNLTHGSLTKAVRASSAIPGIFPPVHLGGRRLIDGAAVRLVPVDVLRSHARLVVGVDVSDATISWRPERAYTIAWQAAHISVRHLRQHEARLADVMICANSPKPVLGFDFTRIEELITLGRQAAQQALPQIQARLTLAKAS